MKSYLKIVEQILTTGEKLSNRTGINTLACNGMMFSHDMRDGFPLLTTKKMNLSTVLVELEAFIKGITSKRWMQERKCFIWDEWASPEAMKKYPLSDDPKSIVEYIKKQHLTNPSLSHKVDTLISKLESQEIVSQKEAIELVQLYEPDLGPVYGYQWRNFGGNGVDQLANLIHTMKTNPTDRRMIVSAWNPVELERKSIALPACHWAFEVHSNGVDFDLIWHQRSVDVGAGLPFNIASYAFLMLLLEQETKLKPRYLKGMLGNTHIYENHITQLQTQLERTPKLLPKVSISKFSSIFNWEYTDFQIENYIHDPFIKLPIAI